MNPPAETTASLAQWLAPSDGYGWRAVARNVVPLVLLLAAAPWLADSGLSPWLLSPLVGLLFYRVSVVMHDCTHYTLFESRSLNERVGLLLGAITGIDFESFRRQHWLHHRSVGEPGDPQGFHYAGIKSMTRARFLWHLFKPLLGLNLPYVIRESVLSPRNLGKLVRSGEIAWLALAQVPLLALVTGFGTHMELALLPIFSTATFGLFFSQLRGIAEHGALGNAEAVGCVRSHAPNLLDRILLYDVNFNFHREHHEHPGIPSCRLPEFSRATGPSGAPVPASMFGTIAAVRAGAGRSRGRVA